MSSFFPLLYSFILFLSLASIFLYLIGQIIVIQKVEKQILFLEAKLQTNSKIPDNNYKLGQIYLRKNFYEKAVNLFRNALKYWDKNDKIGLGSLYNTLGFTYFRLKQYDYAKYYYLQAVKLLPDYTLALTNLGLIYEIQKMYVAAYDIYKNVLIYDNQNKIALSRLKLMKGKLEF